MARLIELLLGAAPLIAVSFRDEPVERLVGDAQRDGLDIAELRVDQYKSADIEHVVAHAKQFQEIPTIATIRPVWEGGDWKGGEDKRLALFEALLPEVDAVDIELSSELIRDEVIDLAKRHGKVVIVSYHDFGETPSIEELERTSLEARQLGADCVKIAAMATSPDDIRRLALFTLNDTAGPSIVIAMGAEGALSRIFFPALGSRVTYSNFGRSTAPGQIDFATTSRYLSEFYPAFSRPQA